MLFDLDDTLFDHGHSSRTALWSVRGEHPELSRVPWPELRETYARLLEEVHVRLLSGELTLEQSRHERFRRLFSELSEPGQSPDAAVREAAEVYGRAYRESWQQVSGAGRLLERVGRRARVAVVTNNLLDEQRAKLGALDLTQYVDELVASEEVGVAKPDPYIFRVALERVGCSAGEALVVGDSWESDVVGARAAGIRAVWLNRYGLAAPDPGAAEEIKDLGSLEGMLVPAHDGGEAQE